MVASGRLAGRDKIGVRVGGVIGKYKIAKHFDLDIQDAAFAFRVNEERVTAEAALSGLYLIRTSAAGTEMSAEATASPMARPRSASSGLLTHLATIVRNTTRGRDAQPGEGTFVLTTRPNSKQQQTLDLAAANAV